HDDELRRIAVVVALNDRREAARELAEAGRQADVVGARGVDGAGRRAGRVELDQRLWAERRADVGGADQLGGRLATLELALRELHVLGHLVQPGTAGTCGCRGARHGDDRQGGHRDHPHRRRPHLIALLFPHEALASRGVIGLLEAGGPESRAMGVPNSAEFRKCSRNKAETRLTYRYPRGSRVIPYRAGRARWHERRESDQAHAVVLSSAARAHASRLMPARKVSRISRTSKPAVHSALANSSRLR